MIQLNLLPDTKLEFLRLNRLKHIITLSGLAVTAVVVAAVVILAVTVFGIQTRHTNKLNKDIKTYHDKITQVKDLDKILTVQNQLQSIIKLHDDKPVVARLFDEFMAKTTPANVTVANLQIDFVGQSMILTGASIDLSTINTYIDTLKFTNFQIDNDPTTAKPAFSNVVLSGFSLNDKKTTFNINLKYDNQLFKSDHIVTLVVPPGKITTRSEIAKPDPLFLATPNPTTSGGSQ